MVIRSVSIAAATAAVVAALPSAAGADVINVHPGPNQPIQRGINQAQAGDTVRVHDGHYFGDVIVNKRVTLTDAGDGRPVVDGECDEFFVIDVDRNGVVVQGLKVVGALENTGSAEVNFTGRKTGTARDLVLRDTCGAGPNAGAEYGVNVYQSERITVEDSNAKGFSDAGIYIGAITETAPDLLLVRNNETFGNNRGIIIEDVAPPAEVITRGNDTHDNDTGIFLHNSDETKYRNNRIAGNANGIHIDVDSDDNEFYGNLFSNNSVNVIDEGDGNCGQDNTPEQFNPCVSRASR
jgi:parallel beta-helix repeat protein